MGLKLSLLLVVGGRKVSADDVFMNLMFLDLCLHPVI